MAFPALENHNHNCYNDTIAEENDELGLINERKYNR